MARSRRPAVPETVVDAVRRDLAAIGRRDGDLACSGVALAALAMAAIVDDAGNSATSRAAAAREMREALDRLRELAPAERSGDGVDDLQERSRLKLAPRPPATSDTGRSTRGGR